MKTCDIKKPLALKKWMQLISNGQVDAREEANGVTEETSCAPTQTTQQINAEKERVKQINQKYGKANLLWYRLDSAGDKCDQSINAEEDMGCSVNDVKCVLKSARKLLTICDEVKDSSDLVRDHLTVKSCLH